LKQAAQGDIRAVPLKGPREISFPGRAGGKPCPVSLSSVDLKVRLNT
jgi:hypothetical protein